MKRTRNILLFLAGLLIVITTGSVHRSAASTSARNVPAGKASIVVADLPDQQHKGLLATATFKELSEPRQFSHSLDLRLTNREGSPKRNVSIEQIALNGFITYFIPPPTSTLWTQGSRVDYPSVASWKIPKGYRTQLPLNVMVRYEDASGRGTLVEFEWEVSIDEPIPTAAPAEQKLMP
jgi:hypothetical protein